MGYKNSKGTISIDKHRNSIRLRWRYQNKRYSISLTYYSKENLKLARKKAILIESDMLNDTFDFSLNRYKLSCETLQTIPHKSFVEYFEEWVKFYKQMDCEYNSDYNSTRNIIKKWGEVNSSNILRKLNAEPNSAVTYNRRLSYLKGFVRWLVKRGIWKDDPLEDAAKRKIPKKNLPTRKPFTLEEIKKVLDAFKFDTYCPKSSATKHSHYYPFIYFMFKTGVRNAEAIGLRVGSIDLPLNQIHIKEVLARTLKNTSSLHRVRKETKNGKERILPLTSDLLEVLLPVIKNKNADDLVFQSPNGLAIDDNNFRSRIFKKILKDLGIDDRVLYACRHTFGSRCIDEGITPVMTAFLMGNNPETALRNYTHQITIPKDLPKI
ncbi:tyrosine recombinase XerD [mine drainage metagenome]|uniref:Tyrosine recombinase XerD n=1 Tax=mine drainage metagenome TaxID=410659 RepID=A0A1J5SXD9_9ZZZZ